MGSQYRLPRTAPEGEYQRVLQKRISRGIYGAVDEESENNNYIFRVRSEIADGKLKRAMYGKMKGDLRPSLSNDGLAKIEFVMWLNPDYTRNMEFDPDANLFSPLPTSEMIIRDP